MRRTHSQDRTLKKGSPAVSFWTGYGIVTLAYALVFGLRVLFSQAFRARQSAGGRDWRWTLTVVVGLGVAGLLAGQFFHGRSWPLLPALIGLFWFAHRRRQALSEVPPEDLSPAMRRFLQAPAPADLIRQPFSSIGKNMRLTGQTFAPKSWRLERQWERDRGLR